MHTVAVCGGGPVGALMACYLAKRGYKVELYEMRQDIRKAEFVPGRSINLALSCRGREGLKGIGLEDHIVKCGIPMYARMIHDVSGERRPIPYGKKEEHILSIDRRHLNEALLSAAEKYDNIQLFFNHKLLSCDLDVGEVVFQKGDGEIVKRKVDLLVGADGAFSAVRRHMMKRNRFDYEQTYIPHGYMELRLPPKGNSHAVETNYLHIWPRDEYMMIGLPNLDNSFTNTLFMPFDMFESLDTKDKVLDFFKDTFPDSIPLIGKEELIKTYLSSKALPMVSVKCQPYNVGSKAVIIGDAAHSMVPFYGQGMNCGFEDCIVLNEMLEKYKDDLSQALPAYSKYRHPDATAICDLAMYNYVEMRAHVNSKLFLLRKKIDNLLFMLFPKAWMPLYTMVTFSRTRYHKAIANKKWQDKVLNRLFIASALGGGIGLTVGAYFVHKNGLPSVPEGLQTWITKGQDLLGL